MLKDTGVVGEHATVICDHCGIRIREVSEHLLWRPTWTFDRCEKCAAEGWERVVTWVQRGKDKD